VTLDQPEENALQQEFWELLTPKFMPATIRHFSGNLRDDQVEDLVSDIFHKLCSRIYDFSPSKGTFFNWAVTAIRNHCIDVARKRGAVSESAGGFTLERIPSMTTDPDSEDSASASTLFLTRVIRRLPFELHSWQVMEIISIAHRHKLRTTDVCVKKITAALKSWGIDITDFGVPKSVCEGIFMVFRIQLMADQPEFFGQVMQKLAGWGGFDQTRALVDEFGAELVCRLVLAAGGEKISLPKP